MVDAAVAPDCENTGLTEGSHCSVCNTVLVAQEEVAALGHAYSDWVIVPSTFDEEGSKTRSCTCGHSDEETIPVLVKASSVSYENEKIELYVNSSENISVVVGPETAENYVVEWISNDQSILKVEGNGLNAVITSKSTLAKVAITVKVTNILNDVEYNTVETTIEVYIYPSPIVEYTFENGIVNEGTASNVTASLLSNVTDTRYQEVTDASYLINKFDTTVLKGDHNGTGNSFGIKGIETGSGDFTITAKYAVASNVEDIYNKANQYYVMGTASETITGNKPAKPCFAITLGKDSKSAGYLRTTVTLNGETKLLYISNQAGYFKSNSLVEFVIVKEGTKVTVSIICPEVEGQAKCCSYSVEFELASAEDFMITNDQVLGFACNYGATRPGNSSYYDDICIYDYAVNEHMFIDYTSDNNATCSSNGTETATCVYCDETHTREELNSKLDHTFENYVSDNNATCHSNCTETAKCKNCDAIDTKEIADSTLEHTFTVYISNGDGTQTAKCENCDATDTKEEILTCQHEFSSNYAYNGEYHWLPCTKCEEVVDPKSHEISNWSITTNPTFETEGSKTRSCLCGYSEEDSISELVKVTSAELSASSLQIYAGDLSNYSLTVNVKSSTEKTPDSYRVAWEISGDSVAAMEAEGVICALTINGTLGTASVKVTVSNVLGEEVVDTYEATFTLTVLKAPIVRYTFDNGQIVNTGTDQTVNGRVTTLNDDKTAIVDVEDLSGVSYTTDASGVANGAIVLNNTGKGNHFTISGLDLGTGDFTITTKIYMSKLTSKTDSSNYLFGIGDKKDVADGYFNFAFKKNGSYSQVRLRLNGTTNWADYAPHQKWVEYTIVREGNKITVYVDQGCDKNGNLKTTIKEFTLTSDASIDFTNCNLGFSSNIGCQDPGDFPIYYDDIMVFDYALYPVS